MSLIRSVVGWFLSLVRLVSEALPSFIVTPIVFVWDVILAILGFIWDVILAILSFIWNVIAFILSLVWRGIGAVYEFLPGWAQVTIWVVISVLCIIVILSLIASQEDAAKQQQINSKATPGVRRRFSKKEREYIVDKRFSEQAGKCIGCHRTLPKDLFEIDHIIPIARGGGSELSNLQLLCSSCNRRKGAR